MVFILYNNLYMETNVIMKRNLNWMMVSQNTKDQMFNANDLLWIYNKANQWKKEKRLDSYLMNKNTKDYIQVIIKGLNSDDISNTKNSCYLESDIINTKRWRINWGTRMNPYLFLDFAMRLSPEFKFECAKWLYDNIIKLRVWAWDWFKDINKELYNKWLYLPTYYKDEANMINLLVFWSMETWQRNIATKEQLDLLNKLQKADAKMIAQWLSFSQRSEKLTELKEFME